MWRLSGDAVSAVRPGPEADPPRRRAQPDGDIGRVLECEFLQYCDGHRAALPEPLWWAMLSNLAVLPGGRELAHEYSRGYPKYRVSETNAKLKHVSQYPPITCAKIRELGYACGRRCEVKSPAALAFRG